MQKVKYQLSDRLATTYNWLYSIKSFRIFNSIFLQIMKKVVDEMTGLVYVQNTSSEEKVQYVKLQAQIKKMISKLEEVLEDLKNIQFVIC